MNKIVITVKDSVIYYGLYDENSPLELYIDSKREKPQLGNIYAARVENQVKGINGAFVKISEEQKCFFPYIKTEKLINLTAEHAGKLHTGDIILAELTRESAGDKLPVISEKISIKGAYFVLTATDLRLSVSRKIRDTDARERLLGMMSDAVNESTEEFGLLARTKAADVEDSLLKKDLKYLSKAYEELIRKSVTSPGAKLLYKEPSHYISFARELSIEGVGEIVVDDFQIYEELCEYYHKIGLEEMVSRIRYYEDDYSLYLLYRMQHFYDLALSRKVYLKSGATLVIDRTEAMTVIDVNSAAMTKKKKGDDVFLKINRDAADEILRQCRLRNLSGIILVDFINMNDRQSEEELLSYLKKESSKGRIPVNVIDITKLGLVEMTRERKLLPLQEQKRNVFSPNNS